jgi:hypothetical protein
MAVSVSHPFQMRVCSPVGLHLLIVMPSCLLCCTAVAAAAAATVATISDLVALSLDVDIDKALADVGRIAVEMADSVGYLNRGIVVDMPLEAWGVDKSSHSKRLEPMLHNCVRIAVVAAAFVAGWS